jgi:hypothetical protein
MYAKLKSERTCKGKPLWLYLCRFGRRNVTITDYPFFLTFGQGST